MTITDAERIITFTENYNKHFSELLSLLTQKQSKVVEDDLMWLLDSLVDEQKLVMRGNSLEAKRLALLLELGYENPKMNTLISDCPDELKGKMTLEFSTLEHFVKRIKALNADITDLIEHKLSFQSENMKKSGYTTADTYNVSGEKISNRGGGGIIGEG